MKELTIFRWLRGLLTRKKKQKFAIIFCDKYDYATKFGTFAVVDDCEYAHRIIRAGWRESIVESRENGYRTDGGWIMVQPL